uniref:Variant surface glycoprotein n=1 Tax=Trypanosoma brucei TaxID=5691 RepID=A0A1V0FXU6_9TRYP|nr:variant surface glycoprotein [Trypanosoma brucei]
MKTILGKIVNLNLTAAEPQMTEALKEKEKYGTAAKLQVESSPVKNLFAGIDNKLLDTMIKDYNDLQTNSEKLKAFNTEYGLPLSQSKRKILKPQLARLANAAEEINTAVNWRANTTDKLRLQVRKTLLKGLYGTAAASSTDAITTTDELYKEPTGTHFPWGDDQNRDAVCKKATETAGKAGQTLATDIICICVVAHSTGHDSCGTAVSISGNFNDNTGNTAEAIAAFAKIKTACDTATSPGEVELTGANIAAAISKFHADLGTNWIAQASLGNAATHASKHRALFGAYNVASTSPTTCDHTGGSDLTTPNKGICIDYADLLKPGKHIAWMKALQDAQKKLAQISNEAQAAAAEVTKAETIATQMEAFLLTADMHMSPQGAKTPAGGVKEPTAEEQNKCAKFNSNETECTKNDCNYDKTTQECKARPGTEPTAAGTGGTTKEGATKSGCARHGTDKTACENDKTSDKQNCAWRKGKDGEDDKETEKCRNGSFLVSTKFSLMAAPFLSLVVF